MQENEARYREHLLGTRSLIVEFFERAEDFPEALANVRRQLAAQNAEPDRSCILYRTRCDLEDAPRWRVWSQLVPFAALTFSEEPLPPRVGLDRKLNRAMTDNECQDFLRQRRYEVFEIRVSKRARRADQGAV